VTTEAEVAATFGCRCLFCFPLGGKLWLNAISYLLKKKESPAPELGKDGEKKHKVSSEDLREKSPRLN